MPNPPDPIQAHLNRAQALFDAGDVTQAGQIWQAIVKREPAHQAALEGLFRVKRIFDQRREADENDRLLQDGCTLFDMGQAQDALDKWERILARDPGHKLAFAYANGARRDLGLAPLAGAAPGGPAAPDPAAAAAPSADADQLVREGVQLFDMGMAPEAMGKWRRALELDPLHGDAPKYLEMARREEAEAAGRHAAPPPALRAPALQPVADGQLETRIWRAEQLVRDWRLEEAVQAFQRLLDQGAQDPRILAGYHQARAFLAAQDEPKGAPVVQPAFPEAPAAPPQPVDPPRALTRSNPAPRHGISLPDAVQRLHRPRWLQTRRNLALAAGVAALVLLALVLAGLRRRETALKEAVAAAKQNALKPVSRMVQIPALPETLEGVRREAEAALPEDPLLAYFRAQEWQRRDVDNPQAVQLVQKAKDKLFGPAPAATLGDFDKALLGGNLEGARTVILDLLRHDPDDTDLRGRARKVILALAPIYASDERIAMARDALVLGRAMFPQDLAWQARLKLLDALQAMAKSDRASWIQLLG
jgi:tetratricopeptide (TPR) repeat protein